MPRGFRAPLGASWLLTPPHIPPLSPEEHAQAFLLLSPCPSTSSFCTVSFRPTWTVSSFSPTCPCFEFLLLCAFHLPSPAEELSSGLLLPQHGVPLPFLRPRGRGRGGAALSCINSEWERPSWCPKSGPMLYKPSGTCPPACWEL